MKKKKLCHCGCKKNHKDCSCLQGLPPVREISHNEITPDLDVNQDKQKTGVWANVLAKIGAKDWDLVRKEIEHLELFYPDDFMLPYVQGMCLVEQNQEKKALPYLQQVTIMNPFFAEGLYNLGVVYLKLSFYLHACVAFEEIVHLSESPPELKDKAIDFPQVFETEICRPLKMSLEEFLQKLTRLAVAYEFLQEGEYRIALALFLQTEDLYALENNGFGGQVLCYSALGEHEIALEYLETWLEFHPDHRVALHFRTEISCLSYGEGMPKAVVSNLLRELEPEFLPKPFAKNKPTRDSLITDSSRWGTEAFNKIQSGDWRGAEEEILKLRRLYPGEAFLFFLQGRLLFMQNNIQESIPYYQLSIRKEPDFLIALYDLALAYEKIHLHTEAEECYERVRVIGANPESKVEEVIVKMADMRVSRKENKLVFS